MDPTAEGSSMAARAPITPTGEVLGGGGGASEALRTIPPVETPSVRPEITTGAQASAHLEAFAAANGPKAAIVEAATPSVLLPPGSVDLRAGAAPAAESAPVAAPASTPEAPKPDPVAEAVRRANERLDPKIATEAAAKVNAVSPDSRTEFDDLQARKDTLTPEENTRREKLIEQQQERTLLLRQKEAGTPLTDAQEARLKELDGAWGEKPATGESKDKPLTPEQRATEMKALREKRKSGDFTKEDEAKLVGLEDDEIAALAEEYNPNDPESMVATAEKLQDIAESRRGIEENRQMKEIFLKVFKEWVAERSNPQANLNESEKDALIKVQELVGGMHKDLLTIINANRQIKAIEKEAALALEETRAQEKKVGRLSNIAKDDERQQQEAIKLEGMYLNLLNKRAQLQGAMNAVRYANNSFRMKRHQVRRSLGLVGFWGGLIESTAIRARNAGGNAASNIDSFLRGKPFADQYVNNGFRTFPMT